MIKNKQQQAVTTHRSAFTLVEMLVSVTLVLLIMSLFAAIFGLASDTIKLQRGIGENDQRARALVTVVRGDFQKRTQRYVLPYYPEEDAATSPTPFATRAGYLYISTNNPSSYQDDLIQFTVDAGLVQQDQDDTPYFGATRLLYDAIANLDGVAHGTGVPLSPQQPEADDRDIFSNAVAASSAAEVMYFLRNGNLMRRVSLLRDFEAGTQNQPVSDTGNEFLIDGAITVTPGGNSLPVTAAGGGRFCYVKNPSVSANPSTTDPLTLPTDFPPGILLSHPDADTEYSDDFFAHFDFSARPLPPDTNTPTNAQFLGVDALNNESGFPLANPANRWGFNPLTGLSREHNSSTSQLFMGRFVHAETSDPYFNWPLARSFASDDNFDTPDPPNPPDPDVQINNGNPMDVVNFPVTLPVGADVVTEFNGSAIGGVRGGIRRVEDVLLTNVHEFRIEIWDERLQQYVVPGYGDNTTAVAAAAVGDFHVRRCLQFEVATGRFKFGPLTVGATPQQPAVFDTWHPAVSMDFDGDGSSAELSETQPPYLPYGFYPPRQTNDLPAGPSSDLAPPDGATYWQANTVYSPGDVVFAWDGTAVSGWDASGDGNFQWDLDSAAIPNQAFQIAYRCLEAGTSDNNPPPSWPETPGVRIADGPTVRWVAIDNRRPLKSVRMTIRFRDQASDQIRQLTMVLPLTDD